MALLEVGIQIRVNCLTGQKAHSLGRIIRMPTDQSDPHQLDFERSFRLFLID